MPIPTKHERLQCLSHEMMVMQDILDRLAHDSGLTASEEVRLRGMIDGLREIQTDVEQRALDAAPVEEGFVI